MQASKFFSLLLKRWYILLLVPLISMAVTYFLVKDMPGSYRSQAKVATGIVDETQKALNLESNVLQEPQVGQEFSNLIEMMKLKKILDQVSYKLIIHDLSEPKPFRKKSKLANELSASAVAHALGVYKDKLVKEEALNLTDPDQNGMEKVLRSMDYDEESLKKDLTIYRLANSDFIYVEFTSENASLSAYVVNTLCADFLKYYTRAVKENEYKATSFLKDLVDSKYQVMTDKINELRNYKINNKILNLYEQSKILYTHLMLVNTEKDEAEKKIASYNGALASIDSKFDPKDRKYLESSMTKVNQEILTTKAKLNNLSDKYIQSNFNAVYKTSIDSLQVILEGQINQLSDKYIYDPLSTKKDLMEQKLTLEVQRDLEQSSLKSLNQQRENLSFKFNRLVPFEAVVQSYERDVDVATRQYLEVLNKYNQTSMESGFSVRLKLVQMAMPGTAEPSKKILLVLLAGIVCFVFCLLVFFIIFLMDHSINTSQELAQKTQQSVLGHLLLLPGKSPMYNIWKDHEGSALYDEEKRLMRSIRFESSVGVQVNNKILCITSLEPNAGKSFLAINLAYSLAMMKQDVLLIDGNFSKPAITQFMQPTYYIEDILQNGQVSLSSSEPFITVAGNRGQDSSLLEISRHEEIEALFEKLPFDVIIIETEALSKDSKAKEWLQFASRIIAVFESGKTISEIDMQRAEYLNTTNKFVGWIINKVKPGRLK